jgi:NAD/NADP transhydrogenase alpha subunit
MNDAPSEVTSAAGSKSYLGFRIAVGLVGLALLALFVMLGSVVLKQSATSEALATQEALREEARSGAAQE